MVWQAPLDNVSLSRPDEITLCYFMGLAVRKRGREKLSLDLIVLIFLSCYIGLKGAGMFQNSVNGKSYQE